MEASSQRNWAAAELEAKSVVDRMQALENSFQCSSSRTNAEEQARVEALVTKIRNLFTEAQQPAQRPCNCAPLVFLAAGVSCAICG